MGLLHELAHIRRHDNLLALFQRLVESLLFFHPVTWWLSAWVSLERELCCDRLVVEQTGRPHAYARMLASLAGARPGAQTLALAMTERPLTLRIRRILNMEDRSMKMTRIEGLGLLAAAVAGTMLTLASFAGPPEPIPADTARRTLERLAASAIAVPDALDEIDSKRAALVAIAEAQLKLGDRAAALATLHAFDGLADPPASKAEAKVNLCAWQRLAVLSESAALRHTGGDRAGPPAALGRAVRYFQAIDNGAVRAAIDRTRQRARMAQGHPEDRRRHSHGRGNGDRRRHVGRPDRPVHRPGRNVPGAHDDPPRGRRSWATARAPEGDDHRKSRRLPVKGR